MADIKSLNGYNLKDAVAREQIADLQEAIDNIDFPEQVNADWNENDENSSSYIKNRPFYDAGFVNTILIIEKDVNVNTQEVPEGWTRTQTNMASWEYKTTCETIGIPSNPSDYIGSVFTFKNVNEVYEFEIDESYITSNGLEVGGVSGSLMEIDIDGNLTLSLNGNAVSFAPSCYEWMVAFSDIHKIDEKYLPDAVMAKPDWNENDKTNPAYIQNRPFYEMKPEEKIIFDETIDIDFEGAPSSFGHIIIGNEYNVVWDGIEYNGLIAFDEEGYPVIGAPYDCTTEEMPFHIETYYDDGFIGIWVQPYDVDTAHTIRITHIQQELKKIDDKYLKPFYKNGTSIVESFEHTYSYDNDLWCGDEIPFFDLIRGDSYTVLWDGVEYECIAVDAGYGCEALGNFAVADASPDTGEPFFIGEEENGRYSFIRAKEEGLHTVTILQMQTLLDNKYLDFMNVQEPCTVIPKQEVTTQSMTYIGQAVKIDGMSANDFIDGVEYIVTINGTEYKCVATVVVDADGYPCLKMGNLNLQNIGNYHGEYGNEPFCIYSGFSAEGVIYFVAAEAGTYTIEVRFDGSCKIDVKCLPDGYPYIKDSYESIYSLDFESIQVGGWDADEITYGNYEPIGEDYNDRTGFNVSMLSGNASYKVIFDGVEYDCNILYGNTGGTWSVLGDTLNYGESFSGGGNGEPFCIMSFGGRTKIYTKTSGHHTIEVLDTSRKAEVIVTMDEKYLPDTIARIEDIQSEFIYVELDDSMQSFMTFYSKISQYKNSGRPLILEYTDSDGEVYTSMPTFFGSNGAIDFMIPMSRGSYVIHFEPDGTGTSIKPTFENDKLKLSNWESSRTGATDFYPSINAMEEYVKFNSFSGSWNDLEDKPFGEIKEMVEQTSYNPREVGAEYIVVYDGVEYDVTISQANYRDPNAARPTLEYGSYYYVGNPHLLNDGYEVSVVPDDRYPFCIYTTDRYGANYFVFAEHSDNSVSHTYALYTKTVENKQIDAKYLPDTVATITYVDEAIDNVTITALTDTEIESIFDSVIQSS